LAGDKEEIMNIQTYTTKTGKKGYILKGAYLGTDTVTGTQVRTTVRGRTKKEIQLKFQQKLREFEENGCTKVKKATINTFDELIDAWLVYYVETVKEGTYHNTLHVINKHIRPLLGVYKLDKITPALLQNKINDFISNKGGQRQDYKSILALIKRIFNYGISLDLFEHNPMNRTIVHKKKTYKSKKVKYYNKEEFNLFLDNLNKLSFDNWKSTFISTYLRLLAFSGMRSREALALEWSDINFKAHTISINKTLNKLEKLEQTPKTRSSIRTIEVDIETLNILKNWKRAQVEKSWELGVNPPNIVFYNLLKQCHYGYKYVYQAYRKICDEIEIPNIGLHGLRHTHATMYVNAGIDYKTIQERLGHETLTMTMDTYAHLFTESKKSSLDNVIKFISSS